MSDLSISQYNPIPRGGAFIANMTANSLSTWRHSKRRIGGDWTASCEYQADRFDRDALFFNGLMRDVQVSLYGAPVWRGFIGAMSYVRDGVLWVRSMADRANAIKSIYTRIGDDLLTNGGAESGAWAVATGGGVTGTATVTQSTEWIASGSYSCKIVVASAVIAGADIQASITIVANAAYQASVSLHVESGSWRVAINRTDTDAKIAAASTRSQTGDITITLEIPDTNTYAGTVRFRITSEASAGTVYGDGAYFQSSPSRAETEWKTDAVAISEFGRIEKIILKAGMSSAAANAEIATMLHDLAWPRSMPPDEYQVGVAEVPDKLTLSLFGYVFTLGWRYSTVVGTAAMSAQIANMVAQQSDYLTSGGVIKTNSTSYQIDNRAPLSLWQIVRDIALAGDASGNIWSIGVDQNRRIDYDLVNTAVRYRYRGGLLYDNAGGESEPAFVEPAWALIEDAPDIPGSISSDPNDDPRRVFFEEVEFIAPDRLQLRREVNYA